MQTKGELKAQKGTARRASICFICKRKQDAQTDWTDWTDLAADCR